MYSPFNKCWSKIAELDIEMVNIYLMGNKLQALGLSSH